MNMNGYAGDRYTIIVFYDTKSTTRYLKSLYSMLNYLWDQIIINNKSKIFFAIFYKVNITFLLFKTKKFFVPVITLSTKDNQKLPELLEKAFKRSIC